MPDIHPDRDEFIPENIITAKVALITTSGISKGRYILNLLISYNEVSENPKTRKCMVVLHPTQQYFISNFIRDVNVHSERYLDAFQLCSRAAEKLEAAGLLKVADKPAEKMMAAISKVSKMAYIPADIQREIELGLEEITKGRYLKIDKNGDAYFNHPIIGRFVLTFMGEITI